MKRFKFSLQTVHDLRVNIRDQAEQALAAASASVSEAAARVEEMERLRRAAAEDHAAKLQSGAVDPFEAALFVNYMHAMAKRETEARRRLSMLERERDARRELAVEAARHAETTTKLRERHRERHAARSASAEQNMLDEMATIAVARRPSSNT